MADDLTNHPLHTANEVKEANQRILDQAAKAELECPHCGYSRAANGWMGDICPFCRFCRKCPPKTVALPWEDNGHTNRGQHIE